MFEAPRIWFGDLRGAFFISLLKLYRIEIHARQ